MFTVETLLHQNELNPLQQRTAFRHMGYTGVPEPETTIPPDACLKLWVIMLLGRLEFLSPDQKTLLIEEILPDLNGLGEAFISHICPDTPLLVIGDGRYAVWYGRQTYLDLAKGHVTEEPHRDILESVAYNLSTLFARNRIACQEIQDQRHARPESTQP